MGSNEQAVAKSLHSRVESQFKKDGDTKADVALAKQLEDIFNYIFYDKEPPADQATNPVQLLSRMLNEEAKEELRKRVAARFDMEGLGVVGGNASSWQGSTNVKTGDMLEVMLDEFIQMAVVEYESEAFNGTANTVTGHEKRIIMGLADESVKEIIPRASKKLTEHIPEGSRVTTPKQMKTDVDFGKLRAVLSMDTEINPDILTLLSASFTAKNYNNLPVHLENVIVSQAYAGIVYYLEGGDNRFRNIDAVLAMYKDYLERDKENDVLAHMCHIVRMQALVGVGQIAIDNTKDAILRGPAVMPKFLIVNVRKGQPRFVVRSTRAIVEAMFKEKANHSLIGDKVEVSYTTSGNDVGRLIHS